MWYPAPFSRSRASNSCGVQSEFDGESIMGYLDVVCGEHRALLAVLVEDAIGVVDVDQHPAGLARQAIEPFDHAACAGLGQMAHVARALGGCPHPDHLVVGPE